MTNYELALELLEKGMADKHHTFNDTGYLIIDLGGPYGGISHLMIRMLRLPNTMSILVTGS